MTTVNHSRWLVALTVAGVLLSACASAEEPVVLESVPTSVDSPATTAAVAPSPVPETAPTAPDTVANEQPAPSSKPAAPTTVAAEKSGSGPSEIGVTGDPVATGPLDASADGLGEARFGDDAQDTIGYFAAQFGPPTSDSGWGPQASPCEGMGTRTRTLSWNDEAVVVLTTGPTEQVQRGADHFSAFWVTQNFPAASRVTVNGSTVLGRSIADLQSELPGISTFNSEIEGPVWTLGSGEVSGGVSDGIATSLRAGLFCID